MTILGELLVVLREGSHPEVAGGVVVDRVVQELWLVVAKDLTAVVEATVDLEWPLSEGCCAIMVFSWGSTEPRSLRMTTSEAGQS